MSVVDSYSETNQDGDQSLKSLHPSSTSSKSVVGQSFTASITAKITSAKFYLKKTNSPTGDAHALLYAHAGTYGASSVPTGAALATSDAFDVSTLTTSYALITFTFTGAQQYEMQEGTYYCIVFQNPEAGTITSEHYPRQGSDDSSPAHDGNTIFFYNSAWSSYSFSDICFYVYGEEAVLPANPLISKPLVAPVIISKPLIR